MCPFPARVDRETIVRTAREMIEADGLDHVSLSRLAKTLGIKAPSLYHHVENRTDLLRAVNTLTMHDMMQEVYTAVEAAGNDLHVRVLAMAMSYRAYALAHPVTYRLLYASLPDLYPDEATSLAAAQPLQDVFTELTGPERSLSALRGLWALVHGFVTLELAGNFRREEAVEVSWQAALDAYIAGWQSGSDSSG
jgi:AcrR family transcriptional regulator